MLSYVGIIWGQQGERERERECVCTLYINWQVVIKCADLSTISSSSPAPVTHKRLQQSESSSPEDHQPSLYLYIPLFPSPPLYLFLLPSSIQSLPLHPSSPFHNVPPIFAFFCHVFSLIDRFLPYASLSAFVFLSLFHKILLLFPLFSSSILFSHFIILAFSIIFFFHSHQID